MAEGTGLRRCACHAAELYGVGLLLVYAVVVFAHAAAPSLTDYANWTYQGILLRDHLLGRSDVAHALKVYPVPNSAATIAIGLLALLLPWKIAAKVWLCTQLAIELSALRQLARSVRARSAVWVIVPAAVFLNLNLWYGFANFQLGLAWMLLLASLLLRAQRGEAVAGWKTEIVLLLAFFTHMVPFAFCWLMVLLFVWQTRRLRAIWHLSLTGALMIWYTVGRFLLAANADGQAGMVASVRDYSAAFWAFKANSYAKSFGLVNPLGLNYGYLGKTWFTLLLVANAALCLLLGWVMIRAGSKALREKAETRFLWITVAAVVPIYLLAPGTALGMSDPGARLLQVALALALVLSISNRSRLIYAAEACSILVSGTTLYLFAHVAFTVLPHPPAHTSLPQRVVEFAHVPNTDQDYFYTALDSGNMNLKVFPTGMLTNR